MDTADLLKQRQRELAEDYANEMNRQMFDGGKESPKFTRGWFYRLRYRVSKSLINLAGRISPDALDDETSYGY